MNNTFKQLKKAWGLSADAPLEELLKSVDNKLKETPENPELLFLHAELLRQNKQNKDAQHAYQQTIKAAEQRTNERGEALQQRIEKKRDHTRSRLLLYTFVPLILLLLAGNVLWKSISEPDKLPVSQIKTQQGQKGVAGAPPEFAFTQWLAKQQMVEIVTTLQEQNPELSFDFSRASSASKQSPMEFMQSLMQPGALSRLRKKGGGNKKGDGKDGNPIFHCSLEPPVQCAPEDIPSAPGEKRKEVVLLMDAYRSIISKEKDCEKLEKSIEKIGEQLSWRKSEYKIKADMEDFATECFFRQKNRAKTIEHARKLQCTGDPTYINSIYWYLTAVDHQAGDIASAQTKYQCFQEATRYIEKYHFKSTYVAARHRESGALAWLYFDDLETATSELEKARAILRREKDKTPGVLQVMSEIDLDLMETYVTANIDLDTFQTLHEEINSSGLLTDGYKQIKDTLAGIYYMQNHKNKEARIALNNVATRFKLMPEYICGWDWSGFRRGLKQSILDDSIRKKAEALVDATNCYLPTSNTQRIKTVNTIMRGLR
jgi:tetratricopeptide (TPR) repeat protein